MSCKNTILKARTATKKIKIWIDITFGDGNVFLASIGKKKGWRWFDQNDLQAYLQPEDNCPACWGQENETLKGCALLSCCINIK